MTFSSLLEENRRRLDDLEGSIGECECLHLCVCVCIGVHGENIEVIASAKEAKNASDLTAIQWTGMKENIVKNKEKRKDGRMTSL